MTSGRDEDRGTGCESGIVLGGVCQESDCVLRSTGAACKGVAAVGAVLGRSRNGVCLTCRYGVSFTIVNGRSVLPGFDVDGVFNGGIERFAGGALCFGALLVVSEAKKEPRLNGVWTLGRRFSNAVRIEERARSFSSRPPLVGPCEGSFSSASVTPCSLTSTGLCSCECLFVTSPIPTESSSSKTCLFAGSNSK